MMVENVKTELRDYNFSCKREAEKWSEITDSQSHTSDPVLPVWLSMMKVSSGPPVGDQMFKYLGLCRLFLI